MKNTLEKEKQSYKEVRYICIHIKSMYFKNLEV